MLAPNSELTRPTTVRSVLRVSSSGHGACVRVSKEKKDGFRWNEDFDGSRSEKLCGGRGAAANETVIMLFNVCFANDRTD